MRKAFQKSILSILILGFSFVGYSQILDDSTHLIYGVESTRFYTFDDVFKDTIIAVNIDSTFHNQHYFDGSLVDGEYYQNLGNSVTPSISLWFNPQINVGQRLAADRFSHFRTKKRKYYNTRSPYTFLKYIQGIQGDQQLSGLFTQNIKPTLNIGFDFVRAVDRVQYASNGNNDRLSETWDFRGFTSYYSPNNRYHLLADFESHNSHIDEQWGINFINLNDATIDATIYNASSTQAINNTAKSTQKYTEISFFQKYDLIGSNFGLYLKNKFNRDKRIYIDESTYSNPITDSIGIDTAFGGDTITVFDTSGYTSSFYDTVSYSIDTTYDERLFDAFENEIGMFFKGAKWNFTLGYLLQTYGYESNYQKTKLSYGSEQIITNELNYYPTHKFKINSKNQANISGNFNSINTIQNKYLNFSYQSSLSNPYLSNNNLISNHLEWKNSFKNISINKLQIGANYDNKWLKVSSKTSSSLVKNYLYYDSLFTPVQDGSTVNILQSINKIHLTYKVWNFEQAVMYSNSSSAVIRIPEMLLHSKVYFAGLALKGTLNAQFGVEARWMSSYYANVYVPLIQDFRVQNELSVYSYPIIDVFGNFQIHTVDLFVKIGHSNQYVGRPGYFSTPYYPAKGINFAFGVKWRFFD